MYGGEAGCALINTGLAWLFRHAAWPCVPILAHGTETLRSAGLCVGVSSWIGMGPGGARPRFPATSARAVRSAANDAHHALPSALGFRVPASAAPDDAWRHAALDCGSIYVEDPRLGRCRVRRTPARAATASPSSSRWCPDWTEQRGRAGARANALIAGARGNGAALGMDIHAHGDAAYRGRSCRPTLSCSTRWTSFRRSSSRRPN